MRIVCAAALALCTISAARAELTTPTCDQMKAGYDGLTSGQISAEDTTLEIAVNAFADNKLLAKDARREEFADRQRIESYLHTLQPVDALLWIFHRYDELETALRKNKCVFEHRDIHLMAPKNVSKPDEKS